MGWPQITFLALIMLGLGIGLAKHGEARSPHNFGVDIFSTAITLGLLYAGGFFG